MEAVYIHSSISKACAATQIHTAIQKVRNGMVNAPINRGNKYKKLKRKDTKRNRGTKRRRKNSEKKTNEKKRNNEYSHNSS